jgi:hypothetical protein
METTLLDEAIEQLCRASRLLDIQVTVRTAARRVARAEGAAFVKSLVMVPVGTQKPRRAIGGVLGPCAQTDGTTDSDAARPRA